eukprot:g1599.t1
MVFVRVSSWLSLAAVAAASTCPSTFTIHNNRCAPCNAKDGCTVLDKTPASDPTACCSQCTALAGCEQWTYNPSEKETECHLKRGPLVLEPKKLNCTSAAGPTTPPTPAPQPDPKKHNILFLMSDSMDGRVLDPTSDHWARLRMPNLRALAAGGTNFVRTYTAAPQCVPGRTTLFTGRHTHQIKAWSNSQGLAGVPGKDWTQEAGLDTACVAAYGVDTCARFAAEQNVSATLLDLMRARAYEPHLFGKVDVGAGVITDWDEANATVGGFHGGPILPISARAADIRRATKGRPQANEKDNNVHPEDWKMIPKCVDFLRAIAAGEPLRRQQPGADAAGAVGAASPYENWMMYCSINIPHPAFQTNASWLQYVNDSAVAASPPVWAKNVSLEAHPYDSYMSISKSVDGTFTDDEVLQVRRTYYAMCAETDFLLGRVLDALRATGQYDRTYIFFVSDHGEMNMEHRQQLKNSMYEGSSRVPMIVAGPGLRRGEVVQNLTSLLDVVPTLLEMAAGVPPTPGRDAPPLAGHSLFPLMSASGVTGAPAPVYPADRAVASQYHSNMGNTGAYMLRWRQWKYVAFGHTFDQFSVRNGYTAQLFDVEADPQELHDVAAEPGNKQLVAVLDARLRAELGDYDAIDAEVMRNDRFVYDNYFVKKFSAAQLRKQFEKAFKGFDNADQAKVDAWSNASQRLLAAASGLSS